MTPNKKQAIAIKGLTDWVFSPNTGWAAVLEGPAGTGKTFTVAQVIQSIKSIKEDIRIGLITPTHKAKKAAIAALKKNGVDPVNLLSYVGTVSAAIGRRGDTSDAPDDRGKSRFRLLGNVPAAVLGCDILLVDEMSMLDKVDMKGLREIKDRNEGKILFTGDFAQLRPVAGESIATLMAKCKQRYRLTEIMRTKTDVENPKTSIDELANVLRETDKIRWGAFESSAVRLVRDPREWERRFIRAENTTAVAFRNVVVDKLNQQKRTHLFGSKVPALINGETLLVTDSPIVHLDEPWAHISDDIVVEELTGEIVIEVPWSRVSVKARVCTLRDAEGGMLEKPVVLSNEIGNGSEYRRLLDDCMRVPLELNNLMKRYGGGFVAIDLEELTPNTIEYLKLDDYADFTRRGVCINGLHKFAKRAWAVGYFGVQNRFAVLQHRWAITAHKSQGSTFPSVAVHVPDLDRITSPEDRRAAKYVAVSRASEELSILL